MRLHTSGLSATFGGGVFAVDRVNLELVAGELFCLLGPSGCGKSTLLRLIGGYLAPHSGQVWIGDRDVTQEPPERRRTGMVFQNYALFPHLSAAENVAFGPRVRGSSRRESLQKAHDRLDWVGLTPDERKRRPNQLSGGQQQRVALARALASDPCVLMLDEPFANLDRQLRERLREELREIQKRAGITTILVTHDREEAFVLGERIGVMHAGKILQVGAPEAVFREPASAVVADFLGHGNLFPITAGLRELVAASGFTVPNSDHLILLRPEDLRLRTEPPGVPVTLLEKHFLGVQRLLCVRTGSGLEVEVVSRDGDWTRAETTPLFLQVPLEAIACVPA